MRGGQQHAPHLACRALRHVPRVHARRRATRADPLTACEGNAVQSEQGAANEDGNHRDGDPVCQDKRPVDHQPTQQSDCRPATFAYVYVGCLQTLQPNMQCRYDLKMGCGLREAMREKGTSLRSM